MYLGTSRILGIPTVTTHPIEGRHFIFLFFYFFIFSQHVVDQNSPVLPLLSHGQRRGCLRDALAARPVDSDWRCTGPHHHAYRVCGGGGHGDGDVVARRVVILAVILVRTFPFAAFSVC